VRNDDFVGVSNQRLADRLIRLRIEHLKQHLTALDPEEPMRTPRQPLRRLALALCLRRLDLLIVERLLVRQPTLVVVTADSLDLESVHQRAKPSMWHQHRNSGGAD
jgi:hypothetical protein